MALLLLLTGCTEYQVKGPDTVVPDSTLADSVPCSVCALEGQPASTVLADPTCNHIDALIADPYELAAGPELFVNPDWDAGDGGWAAVVADFDADGVPEIAVNDAGDGTESRVSTFNADGVVMWEGMDVPIPSPLAGVDLNGADGAELLAYSCREWPNCGNGELTARLPNGDVLWSWADGDFNLSADAGPLVCDLYADGLPEVLVHRRILDGLTGIPTTTFEMGNIYDTASTCVDIDHDGTLEFAMSGNLFSAEGTALWSIALHAGYEGASFGIQGDTDPEPEFLFVGSRGRGGFTVADTDGTVLSEVSLEIQNPDALVVSDLDGNGTTEIVMVTNELTVIAYELDGTLLWERGDIGYVTWMSGWDVDGDGATELLVQAYDGGEYAFEILAGSTGDVLFSTPNETHAGWPPIVADLDHDGHAEIVVAGGAPREGLLPSASIYHQVDNTWPAAGPAWPVPDYHLTNVGPAGEIPRGEPDPPSWMYNVVHARPAVDGQGVNLTPTVVQVCTDTCDDTVQLDVVVTNSGPMPANDVVVRVYAGSTILTDVAVGQVGSGAVSEGTIVTLAASDFDRGEVRLVVDPDDGSPECDEGDNELVIADPR